MDEVLNCISYIFPKDLRIKSVYSTDEKIKSTGINFPSYGKMVSYELYYKDKKIFRVKGNNSPYLWYALVLEALQDRMAMDTQRVQRSGSYTVINELFSSDFNAISEYQFLLASIEHTVCEGNETYTAQSYIERAKENDTLLQNRIQLGHVRGMIQYLVDNGVEIMYIKNSYIYKLKPQK